MADFCMQCTMENFGVEKSDLHGLSSSGEPVPALCEGCGPILVNPLGHCVSPDCIKHHGATKHNENERRLVAMGYNLDDLDYDNPYTNHDQ